MRASRKIVAEKRGGCVQAMVEKKWSRDKPCSEHVMVLNPRPVAFFVEAAAHAAFFGSFLPRLGPPVEGVESGPQSSGNAP
jgi:hypothetical protein